MIDNFHFLRPWWGLALMPLLALIATWWWKRPPLQAWSAVCDPHLLLHLERRGDGRVRRWDVLALCGCGLFIIAGLAGPTWVQLPVPTFHAVVPRVLLLDMSAAMMRTDLSPNRLNRAKFLLQDVLAHKGVGQFALIAFTGEPFVVSPLTEDGQTITALLPMLTQDIMPVAGHRLDSALVEAQSLLHSAGYQQGQLLILTAEAPSLAAIEVANRLANNGIYSTIMPVTADKSLPTAFSAFAAAGKGQALAYTDNVQPWLAATSASNTVPTPSQDNIPLWRDEGRYFLLPALCLLLPWFRRGVAL